MPAKRAAGKGKGKGKGKSSSAGSASARPSPAGATAAAATSPAAAAAVAVEGALSPHEVTQLPDAQCARLKVPRDSEDSRFVQSFEAEVMMALPCAEG